jgi:hydroxymethylbilane synthase
MLPAPGQGALAVETREGDELTKAVGVLDDARSRAAVTAERAVLATLEGGCTAPVGVLAEVVEGEAGDELWVRAVALTPDGSRAVRMSATGDPADATGVGIRLGGLMLDEGARELTEIDTAAPAAQSAETAQQGTPHEQPVTDCERQDA